MAIVNLKIDISNLEFQVGHMSILRLTGFQIGSQHSREISVNLGSFRSWVVPAWVVSASSTRFGNDSLVLELFFLSLKKDLFRDLETLEDQSTEMNE